METKSNPHQISPKTSKTVPESKIVNQFIVEYDLLMTVIEKAGAGLSFDFKGIGLILRTLHFIKTLGSDGGPTCSEEKKVYEELFRFLGLLHDPYLHRNDLMKILLAFLGIHISRTQYFELYKESSLFLKYHDENSINLCAKDVEIIRQKARPLAANRLRHSQLHLDLHLGVARNIPLSAVCSAVKELLAQNPSKEKYQSHLSVWLRFFHHQLASKTGAAGGSSSGGKAPEKQPSAAQPERLKFKQLLKHETSFKSNVSQRSDSRGSASNSRQVEENDGPSLLRLQIRTKKAGLAPKELSASLHQKQAPLNASVYSETNKLKSHEPNSEGEELLSAGLYPHLTLYDSFDLNRLDRTDIYSMNVDRQSEKEPGMNSIYDTASRKKKGTFDLILEHSTLEPKSQRRINKAVHRSLNKGASSNHHDFEKIKAAIDHVMNSSGSLA